ncbi:TIGR04211 family SH3 domain-containing protein, partial [Thermodesulfobacteriota bacterium]
GCNIFTVRDQYYRLSGGDLMLRKITAFGFFIILTFFLVNEPRALKKVYVTDFRKITLRTGPSLENKIIAFLDSSQVLEVKENQGKWSLVRVLEEGDSNKEGWVLNQYLIDRMPYKLKVNALMNENKMLKDELEPTKQQLEESVNQEKMLSMKLKESEANLRNLQEEFATLKQDSSGYLKLKAEYDVAQSKLKNLLQQNEILNVENKRLKEDERNKWFLTGALVLLSGLILGLMFGRMKRRKSSYY